MKGPSDLFTVVESSIEGTRLHMPPQEGHPSTAPSPRDPAATLTLNTWREGLVDAFHPQSGEVRSGGPDGIATRFTDTH